MLGVIVESAFFTLWRDEGKLGAEGKQREYFLCYTSFFSHKTMSRLVPAEKKEKKKISKLVVQGEIHVYSTPSLSYLVLV